MIRKARSFRPASAALQIQLSLCRVSALRSANRQCRHAPENWSLLYPDTRTPVLSPAYDYVATLPYIPNDLLALTFGGIRSLDGITRDQIRRFTDTAGLSMAPVTQIVTETVEQTVQAWRKLPQKDLLSTEFAAATGAQIERVAANLAAT